MEPLATNRRVLAVVSIVIAALLGGSASALLGTCGPFTDTANDAFCGYILELYYLAITTGTSATTYDPGGNVTRTQMAAFLSRTVDRTLKRGSLRAAADKFWTPGSALSLGLTTVGVNCFGVRFDGADVWVSSQASGNVSRVRASDGRLLETWTGATSAYGVLVAAGGVFVAGDTTPGSLYAIDPTQPPGAVTTVASNLGAFPLGIAFDGIQVWTANAGGTVSIATPGTPWTVTSTNITLGSSEPIGLVYDGTNMWATDNLAGTLVKLSATGAVLQTVTVGIHPHFPVFDGTNIWVPNSTSNTVTVARGSTGVVLQTLTGNGLVNPTGSAFDGERVLITNNGSSTVSLWKAADLTPLGAFPAGGGNPYVATSDGLNFWIGLFGGKLVRF